jgi:hypothetical protein
MSALTDSGHTEPLELLETNGSKRPEAAAEAKTWPTALGY